MLRVSKADVVIFTVGYPQCLQLDGKPPKMMVNIIFQQVCFTVKLAKDYSGGCQHNRRNIFTIFYFTTTALISLTLNLRKTASSLSKNDLID